MPYLALRQKGGNCTEKIWQEYGKNTEFIRKGAGSKISWNGAGLIVIFILRFTYNESIQ